MKRLLLVLGLFLAACGPSQAQVETAIAQTEAAKPTVAAIPTAIPEPTATPDSCPREAALRYDAQVKEKIALLVAAIEPLGDSDMSVRANALVDIMQLQNDITDLEAPPCASVAQQAVKAFAEAAVEAGKSAALNKDDQSNKFNELVGAGEISHQALLKFESAAGID